ncbi:MAG: hypothetical protein H7A24_10890 [Leptospiraceae bacterium]|nr:hypothetical protein [Leptospiraceae bacterium]MCP5512378.1 hypothetical protein [Leptospiraceae bacterium]
MKTLFFRSAGFVTVVLLSGWILSCNNKIMSVGSKAQKELADIVRDEKKNGNTQSSSNSPTQSSSNSTYSNPMGTSSSIPGQGLGISGSPATGGSSFGSSGGPASSSFGNGSVPVTP